MDTALVIQQATTIGANSTTDQIAEVLNAIAVLKEAAKDAQRILEFALFERLIESREELIVGDIKFYIGVEKKTTCRDYAKTMNTVLEVTGGDEERLVGCLSAGAFKHGTIKRLLEEFGQPMRFAELFEVTEKEELKEGKPSKKLMSVNTRFLPAA